MDDLPSRLVPSTFPLRVRYRLPICDDLFGLVFAFFGRKDLAASTGGGGGGVPSGIGGGGGEHLYFQSELEEAAAVELLLVLFLVCLEEVVEGVQLVLHLAKFSVLMALAVAVVVVLHYLAVKVTAAVVVEATTFWWCLCYVFHLISFHSHSGFEALLCLSRCCYRYLPLQVSPSTFQRTRSLPPFLAFSPHPNQYYYPKLCHQRVLFHVRSEALSTLDQLGSVSSLLELSETKAEVECKKSLQSPQRC